MMFTKVNKFKLSFFICFIVLPLVIGLLNYLFLAPDVFVSKVFSKLFGVVIAFQTDSQFLMICRNYLSDICWAVSLVNTLILIIGISKVQSIVALAISSTFCVFIEILQLVGIISGTFDYWDIFIKIVSIIISEFIIIKIWRSNNGKVF